MWKPSFVEAMAPEFMAALVAPECFGLMANDVDAVKQ
jgi:hypothetical protein